MLATVASVNSANRIRQHIFSKNSVHAKVIQTPSSLTKEGCGYSLRFDDDYKTTVVKSAKELRINIRAFYREETKDGKTVYIKE